MKTYISLTVLLLGFFSYGFYLSQFSLQITPTKKTETKNLFYDYRGVINVHSQKSIGSLPYLDIISEAKNSGLDFIIFTDLDQNPLDKSAEGYHDHLLVFQEHYLSFVDSRVLFFSPDRLNHKLETTDRGTYLTDLLSQKKSSNHQELIILAHPFKQGYQWTGPLPTGIDGLEVINLNSMSHQLWTKNKSTMFWSLLTYPFNPTYSLLRLFQDPVHEMNLWDQLNKTSVVYGYAGSHASARAIPFADFLMQFPSYQNLFELVSNHILTTSELTGNYSKDRSKIFSSLKNGHFYFSIDALGDPKGFSAHLKDHDRRYMMGDTVKWNRQQTLKLQLPFEPSSYYEVVLLKDGERKATYHKKEIETIVTEPGVYRWVVRVSPFFAIPEGKKWITWIYTNPFIITKD